MSFLGSYTSIGSMMKGSGLEEALEKVYGSNAVNHIILGKAYARALCACTFLSRGSISKQLQVDPTDYSVRVLIRI